MTGHKQQPLKSVPDGEPNQHPEMTDESSSYLEEQIRSLVVGGYTDPDDAKMHLEDIIEDEGLPPSEADRWTSRLAKAFTEHALLERTWTEPTSNDLLEEAFADLRSRGIVALENAGYTMSDGWSDVHEEASSVSNAKGAVFFHGQDVEGAIEGHGLHLAFGSFEQGETHEAQSLEIAKEACAVLQEHGLEVEWDGTIKSRPKITPFQWRKRRSTSAPS